MLPSRPIPYHYLSTGQSSVCRVDEGCRDDVGPTRKFNGLDIRDQRVVLEESGRSGVVYIDNIEGGPKHVVFRRLLDKGLVVRSQKRPVGPSQHGLHKLGMEVEIGTQVRQLGSAFDEGREILLRRSYCNDAKGKEQLVREKQHFLMQCD